ncbi:MAG: 3-deoxy-7-phosphoheptulonate synthase, partial [Oscillospiraceae bacterium]|nr:3-deoxy-7-phosphoheptulonate synthase [Oscillospiraceae bacterium]
MSMNFKRKLPIPVDIKEKFPLTAEMHSQKMKNDAAIKDIFAGRSDRFLLVIGPCSADSKEPVLDYISRMRLLQEKVSDKIVIVPRIYTNKP